MLIAASMPATRSVDRSRATPTRWGGVRFARVLDALGEPVGGGRQVSVGTGGTVPVDHGGSIGGRVDPRHERFEDRSAVEVERGADQIGAAVSVEQAPDRTARIDCSAEQDGLEEGEQALGVGLAQHRPPVLEPELERVLAFLHEERQVGHRRPRRQDALLRLSPREGRGGQLFEREHEREVGSCQVSRPGVAHHRGEGVRAVGERIGDRVAGLVEKVGEPGVGRHGQGHGERVEVVADQRSGVGVVLGRGGDAELDMVVGGEVRQCGGGGRHRDGERGVSGGGQDRRMGGGDPGEIPVGLGWMGGGEAEPDRRSASARALQPEALVLVVHLLSCSLPLGVLGVAGRQEREWVAFVAGHDLLPQHVEGPGIDADVVEGDEDGDLVRTGASRVDAHQRAVVEVEGNRPLGFGEAVEFLAVGSPVAR